MSDLRGFSKRMKSIGRGVTQNADRLLRTVALVADQAVVMATPVDTGRAKSNWIAGLGSAPTDDIAPYSEGEGGSTAAANEQAAMEQAQGVIASYNGDRDSGVFLANNVSYIEQLNDGHSAQAPQNFVETALAQAIAAVPSGDILLRSESGNARFFTSATRGR